MLMLAYILLLPSAMESLGRETLRGCQQRVPFPEGNLDAA